MQEVLIYLTITYEVSSLSNGSLVLSGTSVLAKLDDPSEIDDPMTCSVPVTGVVRGVITGPVYRSGLCLTAVFRAGDRSGTGRDHGYARPV